MATKPKKAKVSKKVSKNVPINQDITIGSTFSDLLSSAVANDEIEASFNKRSVRISQEKYETLLRYFATVDYPVNVQDTLNTSFNYNYDTLSSYRITIENYDNILNSIDMIRSISENNYMIFLMFLKHVKSKTEGFSIMNKIKSSENIVDLNDLGVRVRKSSEKSIDEDDYDKIVVSSKDNKYITFRFIQRVSVIIESTPEYIVRIDLSYVKMGDKLLAIENKIPSIELEIEATIIKTPNANKKESIVTAIDSTYRNLLRILQKSNIIMNPKDQEEVLLRLRTLRIQKKTITI